MRVIALLAMSGRVWRKNSVVLLSFLNKPTNKQTKEEDVGKSGDDRVDIPNGDRLADQVDLLQVG